MTHETDLRLVNLLHAKNANFTLEDVNTSTDELENRWNVHLESYNTLTSRGKSSCNGQLSYCLCSFWIFDEFHQYKTTNSVGWQIAMNTKIGFKLQVTATLGFDSLYDWYFQTMRLFAGASQDPEDDTVMERHGAEALYPAVKSLMHAIQTKDEEAQQDAAHRMIQITMPWMIRRWSESKLANGKQLVWIQKPNEHLIDLQWTEEEQAHLETLMDRYTLWGASGGWSVHWWRLACLLLLLGDTNDCHNVSGQWHDEWPLDAWVESLIFRWRRETFLPILVKELAKYPEPDQDDASKETLLAD